jgi:hypothetical protein
MSTDITTIPDIKLVASSGAMLPTVRPLEALTLAVDSALKVVDAVRPSQVAHTADAIRGALARTETLKLADLQRRFDAAMRPATVDEINVLCARLCACYPTKNRDPLFSVVLSEEVGAMQPSVAVLDAAVRHLLRAVKFLPVIAEVLDALGEAEWLLDQRRRELAKAPERIEQARETLRLLERTPEEVERDNQLAEQRTVELEVHGYVELVRSGKALFDGEDGITLWIDDRGNGGHHRKFSAKVAREARRRLEAMPDIAELWRQVQAGDWRCDPPADQEAS